MSKYPTEWQRKVLWTSATALAVVAVSAAAVWLVFLFGQAVSFLQPVLIPFAVAAVLAYLLHPIVRLINVRSRLSHRSAVVVVLSLVVLIVTLLLLVVVPQVYASTGHFIRDIPAYTQKAQQRLLHLVEVSEKKIAQLNKLLPVPKPSPTPEPEETAATDNGSPPPAGVAPTPASTPEEGATPTAIRDYIQNQLPSLGAKVPAILDSGMHLALRSIGGFLGVFGLLLNAIIIPVYLYFLLVESRNIARNWSEFLPLQESPLKQEVVSAVLEINGYLVAFFRGQLLVSTIDGILIGASVYVFAHLDFSLLIALLVVVLTFIPYLGIILCYIPAVLIAVVQYGDFWHPMLVVVIMFVVQLLESTIISPKVVGDSVGLHPMTVILSVFGWSLLLGGPIGAILAVPLTATIKVLMRRYVWERGPGGGRGLIPLTAASAVALDETARKTKEEASQTGSA